MSIVLKKTVLNLAPLLAALASFIPLAFTFEQLMARLTIQQQGIIQHPLVLTSLAFGSSYSASGDIKASAISVVIAAIFITLYDDLSKEYDIFEKRAKQGGQSVVQMDDDSVEPNTTF